MGKQQLGIKPIIILLALAIFWGTNMALVKIGAREISPIFMAGLRSAIAGICLLVWIMLKKIDLFPSRIIMLHGMVTGLLFGTEFALLFVSVKYTDVSRIYVLLYSAPFSAAIGAHFFLSEDRLNLFKTLGLCLAFIGITSLFMPKMGAINLSTLPGDLMALGGGILWGLTTVYIKKYLSDTALPLQILFYQLIFSAPFLLLAGLIFENPLISGFSPITAFSLFFQSIIIAFLSYLIWFEMVNRYPVSLLHAFSFFTPVFGVIISGVFIMGETIGLMVILALILVSLGMVLINRET